MHHICARHRSFWIPAEMDVRGIPHHWVKQPKEVENTGSYLLLQLHLCSKIEKFLELLTLSIMKTKNRTIDTIYISLC